MPVELEIPYTRSSGWPGSAELVALTHGPALARSHGSTRWHRVRSGTHRLARDPATLPETLRDTLWAQANTTFHFWCGQMQSTGRAPKVGHVPGLLMRDTLPDDGMPLCGTCEGRAIGAGWPGIVATVNDARGLLFEPTRLTTPKVCPGSPWEEYDDRGPGDRWPRWRGTCLACGVTGLRLRGGSRGYGWTAVRPAQHEPGPGLVEGCPFHRWDQLVLFEDRVVCRCQVPDDSARIGQDA